MSYDIGVGSGLTDAQISKSLTNAADGGDLQTRLVVNENTSVLNTSNIQEQVTGFGNSITEDLNSYWIWAERKSAGQWKYKFNAGVGGNTTTDMLARLDDIPAGTTLVTVMEATNDAANPITVEAHAENMKLIFEGIIEKRMRPILIMSPPHDDTTRSERVDAMNLYDYNTARAMGIGVYDCWSQFTNAQTGGWITGASDEAFPATHANAITNQAAGYTLQDNYKNHKFYTPTPRNNSSGINPNANFLTESSAGQPANWATNGNQVSKTLTETPFALGNTWKTNWVNSSIFINSSRWTVTAGDRYLFVIKCKALFNSGSTLINVYLEYDAPVGSPAVDRVYFMREAAVNVDETIFNTEFVVPAGVSTVRYVVNASSGTFDLDISLGQAQFFNLTESTLPSLLQP